VNKQGLSSILKLTHSAPQEKCEKRGGSGDLGLEGWEGLDLENLKFDHQAKESL
jgi:hypothetical protein